MNFYKYLATTCFLIILNTAKSQLPSLAKDYFSSPLEIPLLLSGNFGELRPNHFHSGIDIKTQGVEGSKVFSVADGYVSRLKVSPWGYGNVLYITHPNGYTSVYAHLQKFNQKIETYLKKAQYLNETWEIELFPKDSSLQVTKGELIAFSGNTGSSAAPHLHFEIRETVSEHAVNPLLFGFDVKDNIPPAFSKVAIYPLNEESFVNGKNAKLLLDVIYSNGTYSIKNTTPIQVYGKIGIGISTFDQADGAHNQNGTYHIEVSSNNKIDYSHTLDKISFDETRAINSHIDYQYFADKNKHIQKCFIEDCNPLNIYTYYSNKGVIDVTSSTTLKIKCVAKDLKNNTSTLNFELFGNTTYKGKVEEKIGSKPTRYLKCNEAHTFMQDNILINFPANALYNDLNFEFRKIDKLWGAVGPAYAIHNDKTPLHTPINISIKNTSISTEAKSKAVIVRLDSKEKWQSLGGAWHTDYISASSKYFGTFYIRLDTVAPVIEPVNIFPEKNMSKLLSIQLTVKDNLSGLKTYKGYINGKWVLMEYQPKTAKVVHYFDNKLLPGKHLFTLEAEDSVGNCVVYQAWFYR
jgi:murein DD-endopeptidase MepM/ murein hydrolase activator NlpD